MLQDYYIEGDLHLKRITIRKKNIYRETTLT